MRRETKESSDWRRKGDGRREDGRWKRCPRVTRWPMFGPRPLISVPNPSAPIRPRLGVESWNLSHFVFINTPCHPCQTSVSSAHNHGPLATGLKVCHSTSIPTYLVNRLDLDVADPGQPTEPNDSAPKT